MQDEILLKSLGQNTNLTKFRNESGRMPESIVPSISIFLLRKGSHCFLGLNIKFQTYTEAAIKISRTFLNSSWISRQNENLKWPLHICTTNFQLVLCENVMFVSKICTVFFCSPPLGYWIYTYCIYIYKNIKGACRGRSAWSSMLTRSCVCIILLFQPGFEALKTAADNPHPGWAHADILFR